MKRNLVYIGNHLQQSNKNPTYSLQLISSLTQEGYRVVAASSKTNKLLRYLDMWTVLFKNRKECDYVLIDTYSTWNFYYAITLAWWARRFGLKYIPILHGGKLPERLAKNPGRVKKYCGLAYKVVSPSTYLAKAFADHGIDQVQVIPNAIDLSKFPFRNRTQNRQMIIWLRAFYSIYNPQMAIKAFKQVKESFPKAQLTMVGPANSAVLEKCQKLAKKLEVDVSFMDKVDQETWIDLASQNDIFLNTSNFDNMPLSVIEAMAMGLVIVSTDVGGMPYLIDHNQDGLLIPADDDEQMAEAIANLLTDTLLMAKLAMTARSKVERYNWEEVMKGWKAVLN